MTKEPVVSSSYSGTEKAYPSEDAVNRPKHYQSPYKTLNGIFIQALDVIVAWKLNFNLGNTVKYILRCESKDPTKHIEDLKKARVYLDTEISLLEMRHYENLNKLPPKSVKDVI